MQQDAPLVFAHYETINYLMNKNVTGSTVNPTLELRLATSASPADIPFCVRKNDLSGRTS